MGIQFMISNEECLILMAKAAQSPTQKSREASESQEDAIWTIYNLKYPSVPEITLDFQEFAEKSLRKFPRVFVSLLEEIHLMIRTHLELAVVRRVENCENANALHCSELVVSNVMELEGIFNESCLALADFYIL